MPNRAVDPVHSVIERHVRTVRPAPLSPCNDRLLDVNDRVQGPHFNRPRRIQSHKSGGRGNQRTSRRRRVLHIISAVKLNSARPAAAGNVDSWHSRSRAPRFEHAAERPAVGDDIDRADRRRGRVHIHVQRSCGLNLRLRRRTDEDEACNPRR
jgi:hypothetical protein